MRDAVRLLEVNTRISFKVTAEVYFDQGAGDPCKRGALDRQCRGRQEPPQSFKVVITKARVRRTAAAVRFPSFHEATLDQPRRGLPNLAASMRLFPPGDRLYLDLFVLYAILLASRSSFTAMMKSFSCRPLIFLVRSETVV